MIIVEDKYGRPFVPKGKTGDRPVRGPAGAPRRGGPNTKACGHIVDEGDV